MQNCEWGERPFLGQFMKYCLVLACLLGYSLGTAEVYQWTDENGKVHFGDSVPPKYKKQADSIEVDNTNIVDTPKAPEKRFKRLKRQSDDNQTNRKPTAKPVRKSPRLSDCERQWQAYDASTLCFEKCAVNRRGGRDLSECDACGSGVSKPACRR
jgi:hypothetical protein